MEEKRSKNKNKKKKGEEEEEEEGSWILRWLIEGLVLSVPAVLVCGWAASFVILLFVCYIPLYLYGGCTRHRYVTPLALHLADIYWSSLVTYVERLFDIF